VQLRAIGVSDSTMIGWVKDGRLRRLYRGTFSLTDRVERRSVWWSSVLAAGEGSVLSHMSAAHAWGIVDRSGPTEVVRATTTGRRKRAGAAMGQAAFKRHRSLPILVVHRTRNLPASDRTEVDGLPVTTVARTFVDICGSTSRASLKKLLHEANRQGLLKLDRLRECARRSIGKKGVGRLLEVLEEWDPTAGSTRNEMEGLFLRVCRDGNVRPPIVNATVEGYEVDFFWPEERLIVETDGRKDHGTALGFERDRERDSDLQMKGYVVLRLTWSMLKREPGRTIEKVIAHLDLARRRTRMESANGSR